MEVGRSLTGNDQNEFFIMTRHFKLCLRLFVETAGVRLKVFSAEQPEMCWFEIGMNRTIGFSYIFLGRIRQRIGEEVATKGRDFFCCSREQPLSG